MHVRRALVNPAALDASATVLLDNNRVVVHLYRCGAILAANDRARDTLLCGNGLSDWGVFLDARWSTDNALFKKLLARTLPPYGGEKTMAYQLGQFACDGFGDCGSGRMTISRHTDSSIMDPAFVPVVYPLRAVSPQEWITNFDWQGNGPLKLNTNLRGPDAIRFRSCAEACNASYSAF